MKNYLTKIDHRQSDFNFQSARNQIPIIQNQKHETHEISNMKHTFIAVHWHPYITCCNEGSKLWLDGGCLIGKLKHVNNGHSHLRQSTLMFSTTNSSIQLDDVLRLRLRTCVTRLQLLLPATSAFMRSRAQLLILNSRLSSAEHNDSLARAGISAAVTMTRVL